MKALDKLIEERGRRKCCLGLQLGYSDIVNFANQRVIDELEMLMEDDDLPQGMYGILNYRVKQE